MKQQINEITEENKNLNGKLIERDEYLNEKLIEENNINEKIN